MKYQQLTDRLRQLIRGGTYKAGDRLPTEFELCSEYGVSRQTVRHALSVLSEEGLIEKRQGSGSRVADAAAPAGRCVALILSHTNDYIFPAIIHDAQAALARSGYSTQLFPTENRVGREREVLEHILGCSFCGVLAEGVKTALPNPNIELYRRLMRRGVPTVFMHGKYPDLADAVCVDDDNVSGAYTLARHLIGRGHTRLGGVFKSDDIQGHQRYMGFVSALTEAGLELRDDAIGWFTTEDRYSLLELGSTAALEGYIRERIGDCTGLVAYNDEIAYYLIKALRQAGKRVPEDVAVVSFDNSYYSSLSQVPITSLGHDDRQTGDTAAQLLLSLMNGRKAGGVSLPWTLHVRQSG